MSNKVEQLLHGYRRGHERIAGSIKLPMGDADLVARLSDLSGTPIVSATWNPYLTVYPLPSRSYFAVAQTWPDIHAPRSGCVLTHTLLVPIDTWRTVASPSDVDRLFRSPVGRTDDSAYETPLAWPTDVDGSSSPAIEGAVDGQLGFVLRYFAEGKRPIVWFGQSAPAATLWLLLRGLWPALRTRFAACTLCFQPRTLEDRPFDLMFAPTEAYPRFLKIDPDNVVDASRTPSVPTANEWCRRWAQRLFAGRSTSDAIDVDLWDDLDDDPTTIRRLYLIDTALRSEVDAPQAAVGAMDLVESVAGLPNLAVRTKIDVARRAVSIAAHAEIPSDGLESLGLIEDRLRRAAYELTASCIGPLISEAVAAFTIRYPELVSRSSRATADAPVGIESSWYVNGLMDGFRRLAVHSPDSLVVLRELPTVGTWLLNAEPAIALAYAQALFVRREEYDIRRTLREWLGSVTACDLRPALRRKLLPALTVGDSDLLEELLKAMPEHEVDVSLVSLRSVLVDARIARVIEQSIAVEHPERIRTWAASVKNWTPEHAALLAATYPTSRDGLGQLLSDDRLHAARRTYTLAAFLIRIGRGRFPAWVRAAAQEDHRVFAALLGPLYGNSDWVDAAVGQLLDECDELPISHFPDVLRLVLDTSTRPFFKRLLDAALRNLIRGYLDGSIGEGDALPLLGSPHTAASLQTMTQWQLRALFTYGVWNRSNNWLNAWRLMRIAPVAAYDLEPAVFPEVIDALLRSNVATWSAPIATNWAEILRRSKEVCRSQRTRTVLAVQALQFAFDNTRLPLSAVVAETFLDVYTVVTTSGSYPREASSLFGLFDWDKGKELRKSLVSAFTVSEWPPGDLALAAPEAALFRKIFKRVLRMQGGNEYLHEMLRDLSGRANADATRLARTLSSLLENPNFNEEWD